MTLELNGQNDIVRLNGNLPDEVVATKAKPSLTAEEVAYLETLPPQSKLKQAYLASTAKTELQAYQVAQTQALVSGAWNSPAAQFRGLLNSCRTVGVHVYGNSIDAQVRYLGALQAASDGALRIVANNAVAGYTSEQVLAAMQTNGFHADAEVVTFGEGTNDRSGTTITDEISIGNLKACANLVLASGRVPLLRLPPASDQSWSDRILRTWFCQLVMAEQLGIAVYDPYARYVDPGDGGYASGFSTDGVHPTNAGFSSAAALAWPLIRDRARPYWLPRGNLGQGLVQNNVLQQTDTNADGIADGWTLSGMGGQTINAATDYAYPFVGKKNSVTFSSAADVAVYRDVATGWSVGNRVRLTGVFGCSSVVNSAVSVYLQAVGPGTTYDAAKTSADLADGYVSTEIVIPAGTTSLRIWVRAQPTGTQSGTMAWGALDIYNITAATFV